MDKMRTEGISVRLLIVEFVYLSSSYLQRYLSRFITNDER